MPDVIANGSLVTSQSAKANVHTTGSIAAAVGGELRGRSDLEISDLSGLELAGPSSLSFIRSPKFAAAWASSKAAAALVSRGIDVQNSDPNRALIVVDNADFAMNKVLTAFQWPVHRPSQNDRDRASIDSTARLGQGVVVGANTVIGPGSRIGDGCVLHANVTIGANVAIGPMTTIHPGVTIYDRCSIGAQCILHAGVVIGADGFGYLPDPQGRGLVKVPHIGTVEIGNAVEIGANSCVDRGKFGATSIGDGTKIDNLVQIGHNVQIGRACIVCGLTGIAGSAVLEDGVILAGGSGVSDGRRVGKRAVISAGSGVMSDVPAGETWFGTPARPHKEQMRALASLSHLSDHLREFKRIAKLARRDQKPSDR